MKNYPHLYPTPLSKKVPKLNRTPKKVAAFSGNVLNTKTSQKTMITYNTLTRQKQPHVRNLTRSIEGKYFHSDVQNQELYQQQAVGVLNDDEELFSQSYSKIGKIKKAFPYKNIDNQLNEVLNLIREQKVKISEKMRVLKRSNDQYKRLCESYKLGKSECGINTDDIINSGSEVVCCDQFVECKFESEIKIVEQQQGGTVEVKEERIKNRQAYLKIWRMLEEMNINPKEILPEDQFVPEEIKMVDFSCLSEKQVIKIQKFFIKKLIQKIPK